MNTNFINTKFINFGIRINCIKGITVSLAVTDVKCGEDFLETLSAKLLHPAESIVGEGNPQGLQTVVDLVDAEIRLVQVLNIFKWLVEF